jgi:NAD(P)-dependent dehydrogenase (short-subunit alcohol dehydrogenase family)
MEMAMKLKGNITLVTGADRGIGRGIVEVFAEEGADVAVNYIEEREKAEAVAQWVREKGRRSIVPFLDLTDDQWTRLVDVNLRGEWLCSQVYCRRVVAEGRKGNIVNIGSIQAAKVLPGRTHYAPAKLAIEALTRNMSAEMTPLGIRVNCVHPGLIDTDMTAWVMKSADLLRGILAQISLGRAGAPREIGTVAAFFASEESSYLTGQSIHVDGGWVGK